MFHILIAEDDSELNQLFQHVLRRSGYEATGVENGGQALEALDNAYYDMIISDVMMPGMDGLELIRRLKEKQVDAHFAILSGYSDFEYARTAIRLGVQNYFVKPLEPEEIHQHLYQLSRELLTDQPQLPAIDPQFSEILEYIDLHASEKLRLEDVADSLGYNRNYICHLFQKHIGQTYVQYLTQRRLENARRLLTDTALPIAEIALRCGFSDNTYFNRVFKRATNRTPAEYRRGARKA